jgi:hypothetical protein
MGQGSAQTVKEIEETRGRLETEIRELEGRLPRPAVWTKRLAGVAVGGGAAGTAFWFLVRRRRKKKEKRSEQIVRSQPVQTVIRVLPEDWSKKVSDVMEDGRWRPWAVGIGGAWILFRLAELRQLRRMNQALIARR